MRVHHGDSLDILGTHIEPCWDTVESLPGEQRSARIESKTTAPAAMPILADAPLAKDAVLGSAARRVRSKRSSCKPFSRFRACSDGFAPPCLASKAIRSIA